MKQAPMFYWIKVILNVMTDEESLCEELDYYIQRANSFRLSAPINV